MLQHRKAPTLVAVALLGALLLAACGGGSAAPSPSVPTAATGTPDLTATAQMDKDMPNMRLTAVATPLGATPTPAMDMDGMATTTP